MLNATTQNQVYDAVIVGGAVAGASLAIRLAQNGNSVLLLEAKKFPRAKVCGEFVSPECFAHFRELNVADEIRNAGGVELDETWFFSMSGASVKINNEWFGGAGLALGISRAEMDYRLLRRARLCGATVIEDAKVRDLIYENDDVVRGVRWREAGGDEEREARSRIVIDATGRARILARKVEAAKKDVNRQIKRAGLIAFKAHLELHAANPNRRCEIFFYAGGYGGLNAIENGLSNLCFIVRAADVKRCGGDAEKVLREVVFKNRRAAQILKNASLKSEWSSVVIEDFGKFDLTPARGLLCVGDAAAFIDPFTGSGMLLALESSKVAARAVTNWLEEKKFYLAPLSDARNAEAQSLDALAYRYKALYDAGFAKRLSVCARLRRAAFAPAWMIEATMRLLAASESLRRGIARSTRAAQKTIRA